MLRVGDVINVVMKSNLEKDQLKNDKNNYTGISDL